MSCKVCASLRKSRVFLFKVYLGFPLLVRPALDPFLSLLSLTIDAILIDTIFDTPRTRANLVALLARLLAVGTCVFDLSPFGFELWDGDYASVWTCKVGYGD